MLYTMNINGTLVACSSIITKDIKLMISLGCWGCWQWHASEHYSWVCVCVAASEYVGFVSDLVFLTAFGRLQSQHSSDTWCMMTSASINKHILFWRLVEREIQRKYGQPVHHIVQPPPPPLASFRCTHRLPTAAHIMKNNDPKAISGCSQCYTRQAMNTILLFIFFFCLVGGFAFEDFDCALCFVSTITQLFCLFSHALWFFCCCWRWCCCCCVRLVFCVKISSWSAAALSCVIVVYSPPKRYVDDTQVTLKIICRYNCRWSDDATLGTRMMVAGRTACCEARFSCALWLKLAAL